MGGDGSGRKANPFNQYMKTQNVMPVNTTVSNAMILPNFSGLKDGLRNTESGVVITSNNISSYAPSPDLSNFDSTSITAETSAGFSLKGSGGSTALLIGAGGGNSATFYDGLKLDAGTASRVLVTDANKNVSYATMSATDLDAIPTTYAKIDGTNLPFTGDIAIEKINPVLELNGQPDNPVTLNYKNDGTTVSTLYSDQAQDSFTFDTSLTDLSYNAGGQQVWKIGGTTKFSLNDTLADLKTNLQIQGANPEFKITHTGAQDLWVTKADNDATTFSQDIIVGSSFSPSVVFDSTHTGTRASFNLGSSWTINFWYYRTSTTDYANIVSFNYGSNNGYRLISNSTSGASMLIQGADNTGSSYSNSSSNDSTLNTWEMWTLTGNASSLKLFKNGSASPVVNISKTWAWATPTTTLTLGGMGCRFDEALVYNSVLSTANISTLYNGGAPTYQAISSGLVAGWSFDQASGTLVADWSGNGRNLTLSAGTTFNVNGIVPTTPTNYTMEFLKVARSSTGGIYGETTFGEDQGYTIYQGQRHSFQIGTTTEWLIDANGDLTATEGNNIIVGSTTGTKIGTATTQKLAFYNSTPIVQPTATTEIGTVLSNLGLRAAGVAYPITTSGAVTLTNVASGSVIIAGTGGLIGADTDLTFTGGNRLNATNLTVSTNATLSYVSSGAVLLTGTGGTVSGVVGVSGSFTSADAKTITVTNGVITAIV